MDRVKHGWVVVIAVLFLTGAASQTPTPSDWDRVSETALKLIVEGRPMEAAAMLQRVVDQAPGFGEAHGLLADAHGLAAEALEGDPEAAARRRKHLETAVAHYRRAVELTHLNRAMNLLSIAEMFGPRGLNQPGEAVVAARRLVGEVPASVLGYAILAGASAQMNESAEAAAILRQARAAVPAEDQVRLAVALGEQVKALPDSVEGVRVLLDEALRIADEAVRREPSNGQLLMFKSTILDLQADRVERNGTRQKALKAEGERLWEEGRRLNQAGRDDQPPAPGGPLPPPPPDSAEAMQRLGVELWDLVNRDAQMPAADARARLAQANAAFDQALKLKPDYLEALVFKSLVLRLQATRYEKDAARAKALMAEADRLRDRAMELRKNF
jgi:tetratricopeptide (TPR) repeat protein